MSGTIEREQGYMRIGELADRTGVSVRMLRYYEEQGLLPSTRNSSGQRTYEPGEIGRVGMLRTLFTAGLSSRAIAEVLPCADRPSLSSIDQAAATMGRERDHLEDRIAELTAARNHLNHFLTLNAEHRAAFVEQTVEQAPDAGTPAWGGEPHHGGVRIV